MSAISLVTIYVTTGHIYPEVGAFVYFFGLSSWHCSIKKEVPFLHIDQCRR